MKKPSCDRKYLKWEAHSTHFNRKNISYHMTRYNHVTRKTSCDRKNNSCDKGSLKSVTGGFFPVKVRIFFVTGNLFPMIGIKNNTLCHNTFLQWLKEYFLSLEIKFLSQEEQRTPRVTWRIFQAKQCKQIIILSQKFRYFRYFSAYLVEYCHWDGWNTPALD